MQSHCVHYKLGHRFHALLKVCSDRDDAAPLNINLHVHQVYFKIMIMTVPFLPSSMECLGCTSRCVTCQEHILESDSFKSHTTGAHHKIRGHITCTTSNIIYLISCRICGIQYIGETKNSLKKRFYGHRSTVKTQKLDTPVGQHFNLPNHSISDMILQGIEALANRRESVRLSREKMWIKRVHTIHPHGLNIQEGND